MNTLTYTVPEEQKRIRLDKYLADVLHICSRSQLKQQLKSVTRNKRDIKLSKDVFPGDVLEISYEEDSEPDFAPEKLDLDIIYEDDNVIVVNKPQGMVVHPGAGNHHGTLVQGLLYHVQELAGAFPDEPLRPGIVHRLDMDTSGVIIAAKNAAALEFLSNQFSQRSTKKIYNAIIKGHLPHEEGEIHSVIARDQHHRKRYASIPDSRFVTRPKEEYFAPDSQGRGKKAHSTYRLLESWEIEKSNYSLVRLSPKTGRTHQLRVHMKDLGCPILGDPIYSRKDSNFPDATLMLHALSLEIVLPGDEKPRKFEAALPERFDLF